MGGGENLYGDAGDYNDYIYEDDAGDYNDHIYDDNISDDNDDVHRRDCGRKREVARFLRVFVFPPSVGRALGKMIDRMIIMMALIMRVVMILRARMMTRMAMKMVFVAFELGFDFRGVKRNKAAQKFRITLTLQMPAHTDDAS